MFENIGGKIKGVSKLLCWIGIIASNTFGILMVGTGQELAVVVGLVIMILGSLMFWIGSFVFYGFGQLIENSDILAARMNNTCCDELVQETNNKINTLNEWKKKGLITEKEYIKKTENL